MLIPFSFYSQSDSDNSVSSIEVPSHSIEIPKKEEKKQCLWKNCGVIFPSLTELASHVAQCHSAGGADGLFHCSWEGCTRNNKGFNARYVWEHSIIIIQSNLEFVLIAGTRCSSTYALTPTRNLTGVSSATNLFLAPRTSRFTRARIAAKNHMSAPYLGAAKRTPIPAIGLSTPEPIRWKSLINAKCLVALKGTPTRAAWGNMLKLTSITLTPRLLLVHLNFWKFQKILRDWNLSILSPIRHQGLPWMKKQLKTTCLS